MIDLRICHVERLDDERYRVSVIYGEIVVNNIIAMVRHGRVHAVHSPAIRAKDRWVPFVSWTPEMRERVRDLVDAAVGSYEGAVA